MYSSLSLSFFLFVFDNRPLPSSINPRFQNVAKRTISSWENEFYLHENEKSRLYQKGWQRGFPWSAMGHKLSACMWSGTNYSRVRRDWAYTIAAYLDKRVTREFPYRFPWLVNIILKLEIQRLQPAGSSSTVFAVNLILYCTDIKNRYPWHHFLFYPKRTLKLTHWTVHILTTIAPHLHDA